MQMKMIGARVLAALVLAVTAASSMAAEIAWAKDYTDAQRQATASNKLIMIDFYTDWCGWCKKLDKETYTAENVVKVAQGLVSVKVNAEKEGEALAKKYGVRGFPTILFVDAKGEVAGRIVGYLPAEPFQKEVEGVLAAAKRYPALVKELAAKPNDGKLNIEMATVLAKRGDAKGAAAAATKVEAAGIKDASAVEAYLVVGDALQTAEDFDGAIKWFETAVKTSTDPKRQGYGLLSISICQLNQNKLDEAKKTAQRVIDLKGAGEDEVATAKRILELKPRQ